MKNSFEMVRYCWPDLKRIQDSDNLVLFFQFLAEDREDQH